MTDQPTSGQDDRQHGEQPPSYSQGHGQQSPSPYGPAHRHPGQYPVPGQAGPGYNPYGQAGQQYTVPGPGRAGYNAYGQPGYYGVPAEPKVLSIASLCCGIAALVGFGFFLLPQIAAVILGHMALAREPGGRGLAIAGLVLGYVGIALTILVIVILGIVFSSARYSGYGV